MEQRRFWKGNEENEYPLCEECSIVVEFNTKSLQTHYQ